MHLLSTEITPQAYIHAAVTKPGGDTRQNRRHRIIHLDHPHRYPSSPDPVNCRPPSSFLLLGVTRTRLAPRLRSILPQTLRPPQQPNQTEPEHHTKPEEEDRRTDQPTCHLQNKKYPSSSTRSSQRPSSITIAYALFHSPTHQPAYLIPPPHPTQHHQSTLPRTANANTDPDNKQILSSLHSITSFLLGLTAGILALQSTAGFAFYLAGTVLVSGLFHLMLVYRSHGQGAGVYFPGSTPGEIDGIDMKGFIWTEKAQRVRKGAWRNVWFGGGVFSEALSGFVLGWAGVGGVLR